MRLTKPAGVALQLLGFVGILYGAALILDGTNIVGWLLVIVAVLAFVAGREPAK